MEWRILALLGGFAPLTLKDLARESGLDKSQASRAVSDLVRRGLVLRDAGREDAREIALRLSAAGRRTYSGLIAAARERDAAFEASLSAEERRIMASALRALEAEARRQVALVAEAEPGQPAGPAGRSARG